MSRVLSAIACTLLAAGLAVTAAETPPPAPHIDSIALRPDGEELILDIKISQPGLRFHCSVPPPPASELIIDWPDAKSLLPGQMEFQDPRAPEAKIEVDPGGGSGVRLRLTLHGARLAVIEQTLAGLRIRLDSDGTVAASIADYEVGIGDKLDFSVFGHDDMTKTLEVRADGAINFPLIGDVQVKGKSVEQIDKEITEVLARDFLVDPQVNIEVKESAMLWVTIMGEIRNPGRYVLKRNMRVIDLLAAAGGMTKEAGSRILVTRHSEAGPMPSTTVEREKLFSQEHNEDNMLLERNDIVTVGGKDYYYIRGEVARPSPYYLESGITVLKAISIAGGLTQFANRRQVELLHQGAKGIQEKVIVNLKAIEDGKVPDIPIRPDDTIIVPKKVF